ncbi:hypothetical protein AAVH_03077 [Aphelenchoides avenae]|nr:hypothetical protein AAVH_03077 [Aphelenchus avenae]
MSQQHNVEGSEQIAPSAASEAPLNGDAHVNEASDGEHDKPAVNQELPAANNDSITAQNTEAQKPAAESAQPTQAAEKKKKFPWFRKAKKKHDNGIDASSNNKPHAVDDPAGDQPISGSDSGVESKVADRADPETTEDGDRTEQKKPNWWKRKLCPDRHRQTAVSIEHAQATS